MVQWTLTRDETETEDALYDIEYVDSANPFGDYLIAKIDDINGTKFDEYPRGTRVDASVTPTGSTTSIDKFSGYVVERREVDQGGADALEIEAYTFDQFLRNNTVSTDLTGKSIAEGLETIITEDTPVAFNAAKVEVREEQELTRSFRGVNVENAIRDLAFKSENEDFGVDGSVEFFFRKEEINHISRGIDDTTWLNYDIPERGKEAINEVEVWYDGGNESVVVDDGQTKLDLQDSLGLAGPGTQSAEITREKITTLSDAEDEGRKYLRFRNVTLTGTITTFGLFEAEPGDTINVSITTRGIDTEFRIAEVDYRWGDDQTILTIVEKRGDNDDILVRLTDAVSRTEMREADRDAPKTIITSTTAVADIEPTTTVDVRLNLTATRISEGEIKFVGSGETDFSEVWENAGTFQNAGSVPEGGDEIETRSVDSDRFVNDGRSLIRDGFARKGVEGIDTVVIGNDNANLSRSNSDLENQTASFDAVTSVQSDGSIRVSAQVESELTELGIKATDGTLFYRAVLDTPAFVARIDIDLVVSNNSRSRSVLTTTGQETVRDILIDANPELPRKYAYGTGDATPVESDTSLQSEATREDLGSVTIDTFDSTTDWESVTGTIPSDVPLEVSNGTVRQLQTTQFIEAEDTGSATLTVTDADVPGGLSGGEAELLDSSGAELFTDFSFDYDIPPNELRAGIYFSSSNFTGDIDILLNNSIIASTSFSDNTSENQFLGSIVSDSFTAGGNLEVRARCSSYTSGEFYVDTLQAVDGLNRFGDINTTVVGFFDANTGTFDAPYLYPELQTIQTDELTSTISFTQPTVDSTWENNVVSDNQFIGISTDGSTFQTFNNTATAMATFGSASNSLFLQFGISHYTSDPNTTPSVGDATQAIDFAEAFFTTDGLVRERIGVSKARAAIDPGVLSGLNISESGLIGSQGNLLTRHVFAGKDILSDQAVVSAELTEFSSEDS